MLYALCIIGEAMVWTRLTFRWHIGETATWRKLFSSSPVDSHDPRLLSGVDSLRLAPRNTRFSGCRPRECLKGREETWLVEECQGPMRLIMSHHPLLSHVSAVILGTTDVEHLTTE